MTDTPFSATDERMMARALELLANGWCTTHPNPRVGCVIADLERAADEQIIGEGWHEYAGGPHAEINALRDCAERGHSPAGKTAYVTLEPCSHHGRTPPCASALIDAQVARVVIAQGDANPLVSGRGVKMLEDAGIEVQQGLFAEQARAANVGFNKRMAHDLPFVELKIAASLDGRTALANGQSQWITGPEAREQVHRQRAAASAVLTGIETVLADDCQLTARLDGVVRQPLRVVLDSEFRLPEAAKILHGAGANDADGGEVLLYTANPEAKRIQSERLTVVKCAADASGRLDLQAVLRDLAEREINEVLVEAGATLAGAFVQAGLADAVTLYLAPCFLGPQARPMLMIDELTDLNNKVRLTDISTDLVGDDICITAGLAYDNDEQENLGA